MFTMETGKMTRLMDMANTTTQMLLFFSGQTMPATRVSIKMAKNMEEVSSCGQMDQLILVTSLKITFMAWEFTPGLTEGNMTVSGRITRWTARECLLGPMEEDTTDSMSMIKRRDKVFTRGQMDASTMATGRTENNMARECIIQARAKLKWENGLKESALTGLMTALKVASSSQRRL